MKSNPYWRCLASVLVFACAGCSQIHSSEKRALAFRDVNVFDGLKSLGRQTVIVSGDRIVEIGSKPVVPAGAISIDGTGKTLLPGLINAHVHTVRADQLDQHAIFGVTTVLDMGSDLKLIEQLRLAQKNGKAANRADIFSAGTFVTVPGGHGTEYGLNIPTLSRPEDAQQFIDARIAEGSEFIKLIYDDATAFGFPQIPTLSKKTLAAAIAAAHQRNKLVIVHVASLQAALEAVEMGADGLAHLFVGPKSDPAFAKLAADRHVFVIPTLTALQAVCGRPGGRPLLTDVKLSPYLSTQDVLALKGGFSTGASCAGADIAVPQLKAAGVPILAGDDVPSPGTTPGASLHRELELLVAAGLTPSEALVAAASAPAKAFRIADRGVIAPGMRADLLLVDGDPTRNILDTRNIAGVWKAGVAVDRKSYLAGMSARNANKDAATSSGSGLISDFEQDTPSSRIGAGWSISTDALRGGKSVAHMSVVPGGASGSKGALLVEGDVMQGGGVAEWAGAMFSPGPAIMMPANFAGRKEISFWAKGDKRAFEVMVFAQALGMRPPIQTFDVGPEWKQFRFPLSSFNGFDGSGMMGLFIGAGPPAGKFRLYIDDVRID
ncbi:MAG TPA: amidohydrolase family protein [Bryobacteraceae bacterium]